MPYVRRDLHAVLYRTVSTAHIDEVALLGGGTDATHVGGIGGTAAAGLGLVVTEDKEVVGAGLELGAKQRLIGVRITPSADIVARLDTHIIKGSNWLIRLARIGRILKEVVGESF